VISSHTAEDATVSFEGDKAMLYMSSGKAFKVFQFLLFCVELIVLVVW